MHTHVVFPGYLESFALLQQHIRSQLENLNNTEKGAHFAHFVQRLIPQSEVGSGFQIPRLGDTVASDGGVDLVAQGRNADKDMHPKSWTR